MRRDDLEPGKSVERALEDEVLQRDRGVKRIADRVREPAVALEALGKLRRRLRMDEQHGAELLGFLQHRKILLAREIVARNAAADRRAFEPLLLDRGLEHLRGKIGR